MILNKDTALLLFKKEYETDLSDEQLKEIVDLYYDFIREEIESGNLEQIRMKYFGSFKPMFGKINHLKRNINWEKFTPKEKERYVKLFKRLEEINAENLQQPPTDVGLLPGEL